MEDIIIPLAGMITTFGSIVLFVKILTDFWLRRRLINKGLVDENGINLLKKHASEGNKYSSLKWGLLVLFGGLSLIVIQYLPFDGENPLPYGVFSVFIAVGFLIYYFYMKKETEKSENS